MANLIQDFKDNCSNFLYIFISDDAANKVFGNAPVILQKRKNQIAYVSKAAQMSKYSYEELKKTIGDEIVSVYGKTPGEILLDVAEGKNVYSLKEVRNNSISGIGACRVGAIDDLGYPKGADKNKYATVWDAENNIAIGRYDLSSGKQVSYYDTKTNTWKKGATPDTDINSRNMWANNINWNNIILAIINLIGSLFGISKAQNVACYQSDGWYGVTKNTTQNSTNNILPIALLAVVGYYLVVKDKKDK